MTDESSCYRHPDRPAGVRCQRCERLICPDCMRSASVGFHCPECLTSGAQQVYRAQDLVRKPLVTLTLIGVNVLVFVADLISDGQASRGADSFDLTVDGLLFGPSVAIGEWWRVITSGFLHASWFHLGSNMLMLWILGQSLEPALGRIRFAGVYSASLLAGSIGVLVLDPLSPTLGASGAVFGVLGALIVLARDRGISLTDTGLGAILVINLLVTFAAPQISVGGHLGGLAGGFVVGWILVSVLGLARQGRLDRRVAGGASIGLAWGSAAVFFWVALAVAERVV